MRARKPETRCEECGDLQAHEFSGADDMLHAVQVAAAEVDRGALVRIENVALGAAEQQALDSALAADAMPGRLRYRFKCAVCGDRFELNADIDAGSGSWVREA